MKAKTPTIEKWVNQAANSKMKLILENDEMVECLQLCSIPGICDKTVRKNAVFELSRLDKVAQLVYYLLLEPETAPIFSEISKPCCYSMYKYVYNANKLVKCGLLKHQVAQGLFPGIYLPNAGRNHILARLADEKSFDELVAHAFSRFMRFAIADLGFEQVVESFGPFMEEFCAGMMYHMGSPEIQKLVFHVASQDNAPILNEICIVMSHQLIQQLFPYNEYKEGYMFKQIQGASQTYKEKLRLATKYALVDILRLAEKDSVGATIVEAYWHDEAMAEYLVRASFLQIQHQDPNIRSSCGMEVVVALIDQVHCGCCQNEKGSNNIVCAVNKWPFLKAAIDAATQQLNDFAIHKKWKSVDLPVIHFIRALVRVQCLKADFAILESAMLERLIDCMLENLSRDIIHTTILQIFQEAFACEDKKSHANIRTVNDQLRQHIVCRSSILTTIMQNGKVANFLRLGMLINASFPSTEEMLSSLLTDWNAFTTKVIKPAQETWKITIVDTLIPDYPENSKVRKRYSTGRRDSVEDALPRMPRRKDAILLDSPVHPIEGNAKTVISHKANNIKMDKFEKPHNQVVAMESKTAIQ